MKLKRCTKCYGTGKTRVQQGFFSILKECPDCKGLGNVIVFKPLLPTMFELIFGEK